MSTITKVVLEPAAQEFAEATANPPYLPDLGPVEGRKTVDQVQSGEIEKPDVDIEDATVTGGPSGQVSIRILRPKGASGQLPVILYTHGAGWGVRTAPHSSHPHPRGPERRHQPPPPPPADPASQRPAPALRSCSRTTASLRRR